MNQAFTNLDESQIFGLTLYGEARGEPDEGKIAVGSVILERVKQGNRGKNIKEVCLWRKQFSCFNEFDKGYGKILHIAETWDEAIATDFVLMSCFGISVGMISGYIPEHPVILEARCLNYLNPKQASEARERWLESGMKSVLVIEKHEFFA